MREQRAHTRGRKQVLVGERGGARGGAHRRGGERVFGVGRGHPDTLGQPEVADDDARLEIEQHLPEEERPLNEEAERQIEARRGEGRARTLVVEMSRCNTPCECM